MCHCGGGRGCFTCHQLKRKAFPSPGDPDRTEKPLPFARSLHFPWILTAVPTSAGVETHGAGMSQLPFRSLLWVWLAGTAKAGRLARRPWL